MNGIWLLINKTLFRLDGLIDITWRINLFGKFTLLKVAHGLGETSLSLGMLPRIVLTILLVMVLGLACGMIVAPLSTLPDKYGELQIYDTRISKLAMVEVIIRNGNWC